MPRTTFRLALALLFIVASLGAHDAHARNAGPRLSKRAYYQKAKRLRARGNRQYRLSKRGGIHAKMHLARAQRNHTRAKVFQLKARAKKALHQGNKAKADKLWRKAQALEATIKPVPKRAPKTASKGKGNGKSSINQVPDAEQPAAAKAAAPKAPVTGASYGEMKRYLANKNLSSAVRVLDAMEREAAHAHGIKGLWKRFQAKRGRRTLRRAAVRVGREAIRSGGAAGDQQLLEQRREYAKQVRALRAAGMTPEQRQALRAELAQVPNLRTQGSNYARARAVLRHLNQKGQKYENKPVRRVIARLGDMVFGSVKSANAKLDRSLISQARYLMAKGPDGAMQARLLLLNAKGRGLSKTWRYRRTHRAARRSLSKAIKQAIKEGNPSGVELAYQLRESYEMDRRGPSYRLGDREIRKMNQQIERAELSMVKMLAKQAAWIAKYPKQAQNFFGYDSSAAAIANNLARETVNRLMENGTSVPGSILRQLNATDAKLTQRKPGLLRRIASLPLKVALLPFKVLKWATVTQARHIIWGNSGGAPPPPMKAERLNQIMQEAMPRQQEMEQGYGEVAQGSGAPRTPADAMM